MYFRPRVIYRVPDELRKNSVIRYIGNRVLRNNKNFLCAYVGSTGVGKSYAAIATAEDYAQEYGIPFDPSIHIISSLKELLLLITNKEVDKKIQFGSVLVFDEPQVEGNARDWQSDMNKALGQLISTFRNQRLVVLFATPYLEMIDKQSRILFHGEFKVLGFDRNTGITKIKPRFLEYNKAKNDFYRKRLLIQYAVKGKRKLEGTLLNTWEVEKASKEALAIYEGKKKKFTDDLNKKLLESIQMEERQKESVNKNEELLKVKELYDKYGEDYLKMTEAMPHLNPFTLERYVQFIKRSHKIQGKGVFEPKIPKKKAKGGSMGSLLT